MAVILECLNFNVMYKAFPALCVVYNINLMTSILGIQRSKSTPAFKS